MVSYANKTFGKMSKYFCEKMVEDSRRGMYDEETEPKEFETVEITKREEIFKGQKIEVLFEGYNEDLSDLRLKVFVNGAMKFVSQKGAFIVASIEVPKIVRSKWFFTTEFHTRTFLKFKRQNEFERFQKFCAKLRDCQRVEDMYIELRETYLKDIGYIEAN